MNKIKRIIAVMSLLCIVAGALSPSALAAKKPSLNKKSVNVTVGKKVTIKAKNISGYKLTAKIKKTKLASVKSDKKGVYSVLGKKAGTTKLVIKAKKKKKNYTLSCTIHVKKGTTPLPAATDTFYYPVPTIDPNQSNTFKSDDGVYNALNYEPLADSASKFGFKLGTVIHKNEINKEKLSGIIKKHFNSVTAANEMKDYTILQKDESANGYVDEDSMPVLDFTDGDAVADFAKESGIRMRGHTLVWHADYVDWMYREGYKTSAAYVSEELAKKRLRYYIEQVITHFETKYPDLFYCWDVVNEAVGAEIDSDVDTNDVRHIRVKIDDHENPVYAAVGNDYVEYSFKCAHETLVKLGKRDSTELIYNDFATYEDMKRESIVNMTRSINSYMDDGHGGYVKLCDGVGMQGYIGGREIQYQMVDLYITDIEKSIMTFHNEGLDVQITELTVSNDLNTPDAKISHARFYKDLFDMFIRLNKSSDIISSISIWGLYDIPGNATNLYDTAPFSGILDVYYQPKNSFISIANLMH